MTSTADRTPADCYIEPETRLNAPVPWGYPRRRIVRSVGQPFLAIMVKDRYNQTEMVALDDVKEAPPVGKKPRQSKND